MLKAGASETALSRIATVCTSASAQGSHSGRL